MIQDLKKSINIFSVIKNIDKPKAKLTEMFTSTLTFFSLNT